MDRVCADAGMSKKVDIAQPILEELLLEYELNSVIAEDSPFTGMAEKGVVAAVISELREMLKKISACANADQQDKPKRLNRKMKKLHSMNRLG